MNGTRLGLLFLLSSVQLSCWAYVHGDAKFKSLSRDAREVEVMSRYDRTRDLETGARDVQVFLDAMPEGLYLEAGTVKPSPGYDHTLIGEFELVPAPGKIFAFPDYRAQWKRPFCWAQQPLLWVTITMWGLVPTYYPCYLAFAGPPGDSIEGMISDARIMARAAGGDFVVITQMDRDRDWSLLARGYIFKKDQRLAGYALRSAQSWKTSATSSVVINSNLSAPATPAPTALPNPSVTSPSGEAGPTAAKSTVTKQATLVVSSECKTLALIPDDGGKLVFLKNPSRVTLIPSPASSPQMVHVKHSSGKTGWVNRFCVKDAR